MRRLPAVTASLLVLDAAVLSVLTLWAPHCTYPALLCAATLRDLTLATALPALPLAALAFVSSQRALGQGALLHVLSAASATALTLLLLAGAALLLSAHTGGFCIPVN
jgi:hypothetical protein